jgi:hypothetical protein
VRSTRGGRGPANVPVRILSAENSEGDHDAVLPLPNLDGVEAAVKAVVASRHLLILGWPSITHERAMVET